MFSLSAFSVIEEGSEGFVLLALPSNGGGQCCKGEVILGTTAIPKDATCMILVVDTVLSDSLVCIRIPS